MTFYVITHHSGVTVMFGMFCIHRVNWVYGALVVTLWTCYGTL